MRPTLTLLVMCVPTACAAAPPGESSVCARTATSTSTVSVAGNDVIALLARDGFPDPSSPLAHAAELAMFDDQVAPLRALSERLRARVSELGASRQAALVALDHALDSMDHDAARLRSLAADIARLEADSTLVQVEARLETRRILRPDQLIKLRALRSATSL